MALKSKEWFLAKCLDEERRRSPLSHLSSRIMDLGLKGSDKTRGQVLQACGAVQEFITNYPAHTSAVTQSSPLLPFPLSQHPAMLSDWVAFFSAQHGQYGQPRFGYNWDTVRTYLTAKYAGSRTGGGGGDNEFEMVLRLMPEFI